MKVIELLQNISEGKLKELPLKISYRGKLYTKEGAGYTYYEVGKEYGDTLKIDTFDLNVDVDVILDKEDKEDKENVFVLCEKIRNILDEIEYLV